MTEDQAIQVVTLFFIGMNDADAGFILPEEFLAAEKVLGQDVCKVIYDTVRGK
jgi:hypothetical protein